MLSLRTSLQSQRDLEIDVIAAGHSFSVFATSVGQVQRLHAMGSNYSGELGRGVEGQDMPLDVMKWRVDGKLVDMRLTGPFATHIAAGSYHVLIRLDDGTVYACGTNSTGQIGMGSWKEKSLCVERINGFDGKVTDVAAGVCHSLFLMEDGRVFGCGVNTHGQLADVASRQYTPAEIKGFPVDTKISQIAAGEDHSVFLAANGKVYTCGDVLCPPRKFEDDKHPLRSIREVTGFPVNARVVQISANYYESYALTDEGRVYRWGNGLTANPNVPVEVSFPAGVKIQSIHANGRKVNYLAADNRVFVAGFNGEGQLGVEGLTDDVMEPVLLPGFPEDACVTQIVGGYDFSMYCLDNNSIQSCGFNRCGQQGRPKGDRLTTMLHHPTEMVEHHFQRSFTVFNATRGNVIEVARQKHQASSSIESPRKK